MKRSILNSSLRGYLTRNAVLMLALFVAETGRCDEKTFASGTSWTTSGNWSPTGSPHLSDNVVVNRSSALTITAAAVEMQDLANISTSSVILENNSSSGDSTLTLNGGRGSGVPLITSTGGSKFTIRNGSLHALTIVLGASGEIHAGAGGISIGSNIIESGSGQSVTKTGGGELLLFGTSSYTGPTAVNEGTLRVGDGGGTGSLSVLSTLSVAAGANLVFDRSDQMTQGVDFSGMAITGGGNLELRGGPLVLNADNSYLGTTKVEGGILEVNGDQSAATGAVTIASGAKLAGSGTVGGAVTIKPDGVYSPGVDGEVGHQSLSSGLTFNFDSIFEWDLNENSIASGFDTVSVNGDIAVSNTRTVFNVVFGDAVDMEDAFWSTPYVVREWSMASIFGEAFSSGAFQIVETSDDVSSYGSFSIDGTNLTWTAVPEPSSAVAGLLLGAGLLRRRRR